MSVDLHAVGRWLAANYEGGDLWVPGMRVLYEDRYRGKTLPVQAFRVSEDRVGMWHWATSGRERRWVRGSDLPGAYPDLSDPVTVGALWLQAEIEHPLALRHARFDLMPSGFAVDAKVRPGVVVARALVPADIPAPWEVTP